MPRGEPGNIEAGGNDTPSSRSTGSRVLNAVLVVFALVVGALVLFVVSVTGLKALRRWRRRHAPTERGRVIGAWDEALERLAEARIHRRPASTPVEFAMHEGPAGGAGGAGPPLLALAHVATTAFYAPDEPTKEVADGAWTTVSELEKALRENASPRARIRRRLDPRVLRTRLPGDAEAAEDGATEDDALIVVTVTT